MTKSLPFKIGTRVVALRNVGRVKEGQPGIVTGVAAVPFFFWSRAMYLCTFAGNMKLAVKPSEIDDYDHRYTLSVLEKDVFDPSHREV